mgnify:CR=1 FL=1
MCIRDSNNPFGKKIVSQLINDNVPELGSTALESDVYGNEQKWADIAQAINVKNVGVGVDLNLQAVSYTHLRDHETPEHLVCRLLLEKKKN